nr:MAG: hypothetical protein [Lake Baikal virophage 5]WPF46545.1 MAG: hypothetical protein [Lake Baikal virophage 5]
MSYKINEIDYSKDDFIDINNRLSRLARNKMGDNAPALKDMDSDEKTTAEKNLYIYGAELVNNLKQINYTFRQLEDYVFIPAKEPTKKELKALEAKGSKATVGDIRKPPPPPPPDDNKDIDFKLDTDFENIKEDTLIDGEEDWKAYEPMDRSKNYSASELQKILTFIYREIEKMRGLLEKQMKEENPTSENDMSPSLKDKVNYLETILTPDADYIMFKLDSMQENPDGLEALPVTDDYTDYTPIDRLRSSEYTYEQLQDKSGEVYDEIERMKKLIKKQANDEGATSDETASQDLLNKVRYVDKILEDEQRYIQTLMNAIEAGKQVPIEADDILQGLPPLPPLPPQRSQPDLIEEEEEVIQGLPPLPLPSPPKPVKDDIIFPKRPTEDTIIIEEMYNGTAPIGSLKRELRNLGFNGRLDSIKNWRDVRTVIDNYKSGNTIPNIPERQQVEAIIPDESPMFTPVSEEKSPFPDVIIDNEPIFLEDLPPFMPSAPRPPRSRVPSPPPPPRRAQIPPRDRSPLPPPFRAPSPPPPHLRVPSPPPLPSEGLPLPSRRIPSPPKTIFKNPNDPNVDYLKKYTPIDDSKPHGRAYIEQKRKELDIETDRIDDLIEEEVKNTGDKKPESPALNSLYDYRISFTREGSKLTSLYYQSIAQEEEKLASEKESKVDKKESETLDDIKKYTFIDMSKIKNLSLKEKQAKLDEVNHEIERINDLIDNTPLDKKKRFTDLDIYMEDLDEESEILERELGNSLEQKKRVLTKDEQRRVDFIKQNPKIPVDQMRQLMKDAGFPPIYYTGLNRKLILQNLKDWEDWKDETTGAGRYRGGAKKSSKKAKKLQAQQATPAQAVPATGAPAIPAQATPLDDEDKEEFKEIEDISVEREQITNFELAKGIQEILVEVRKTNQKSPIPAYQNKIDELMLGLIQFIGRTTVLFITRIKKNLKYIDEDLNKQIYDEITKFKRNLEILRNYKNKSAMLIKHTVYNQVEKETVGLYNIINDSIRNYSRLKSYVSLQPLQLQGGYFIQSNDPFIRYSTTKRFL